MWFFLQCPFPSVLRVFTPLFHVSFLSFNRHSFPLFAFLFLIFHHYSKFPVGFSHSFGCLQKQSVIQQLNWRTEMLSLSLRWKLTSLELFISRSGQMSINNMHNMPIWKPYSKEGCNFTSKTQIAVWCKHTTPFGSDLSDI